MSVVSNSVHKIQGELAKNRSLKKYPFVGGTQKIKKCFTVIEVEFIRGYLVTAYVLFKRTQHSCVLLRSL